MTRRTFLASTSCMAGTAAWPLRAGQVVTDGLIGNPAQSWLARLPKIELHLHIEGAIPKPALWQLVTKYGDASVPNLEAFERRFEYTGLQQFFRTFDWATGFLREPDDFTFIGREIARDLARQNIRYVEAYFSPTVFRRRLEPGPIAEALRTGLDDVPSVDVRLVADLGRNLGPEGARQTLDRIAELRRLKVIGVGLAGFEPQYAPELFSGVFERARELGFKTTAHAGESAGPPSIWGAIRALRVDRIGHATRAVEDPELVRHLTEHRIPLELCPLSNVRTGVVASMREHPIRRYFDAGIPVSLNTDDPLFFGNSLAAELAAVQQEHRFTRDEIKRLMVSALETSWLSVDEKARFLSEFRADPTWNEQAPAPLTR